MPSVKELGFFSQNRLSAEKSNAKTKDLHWYKYHFQNARDKSAIGEATPDYLFHRQAPRRIAEVLPNAKLVACLRHPTDRTHSHYWMARGLGETNRPFEEVICSNQEQHVERSFYGEQLDRYFSYFDRDQFLILISEEIFAEPSTSLNDICSFLEVDDTFYRSQEWISGHENQAARSRSELAAEVIRTIATWMRHAEGVRQVLDVLKATGLTSFIKDANREPLNYPEMDPEVRKKLDQRYASTVLRVEEILGRRIEAWREKMLVNLGGR